MRRVLWSIFAILLATKAAAQVIEVRSGEHSTFTRLIIDLPARMEWRLAQNDSNAILTFPNQRLDFDIGAVFERIPRDRLASIIANSEKSVLNLKLGCNCEVSVFWYGKSLLVLDITDLSDKTPKVFEAEITPLKPVKPKRPLQVARPQARKSQASAHITSNFQHERYLGLQLNSSTVRPLLQKNEAETVLISEARTRLIRQLGRAATQGLLSPQSNLSIANAELQSDPKAPNNQSKETIAQKPIEAEPGLTANINLQAQSSIDRDFLELLSDEVNAAGGLGCINIAHIDVGNWGNNDPFSKQVSPLRIGLMGEFDRVNEDVAIELAKRYIYFGFGAEARLALNLVAEETVDITILLALSEIMENGHSQVGSVLSSQLICNTSAALWSVLSYQYLPPEMPIDRDAVLRTFSALPSHLRRFLGPILSRRFLESGYRNIADDILRILNRTDETITPKAQLVAAEINFEEGDTAKATGKFKKVAQTGSEPSAQALVKLIDTKLATGQEISFDEAQLAGAYTQQYRGEPIGHDLARVYVIALAASDAFGQAYDELERLSRNLAPEEYQVIMSVVLAQLTEHATDLTFLQHIFAHHLASPSEIPPHTANAASERLLTLGFVSQARSFVVADADGLARRDRQLLRARISLAEGRPRQAEVDLLNMTDETANLLRAEARSSAGEHKAAAELFASTNKSARSLSEAWFAEDWESIVTSEDEVLANVAKMVSSNLNMQNNTTDEDSGGILAKNLFLVEQSTSARETIRALLLAKPMPSNVPE